MAAPTVDAPRTVTSCKGQHSITRSFQEETHGTIYASPRAARQFFTICTESDEDSTPRAPNPELSRLEAKEGLVNLSSHWPDGSDDSWHVTNGQPSDGTKDTTADDTVRTMSRSTSDDDLVLVTDKSTQTVDLFQWQRSTSSAHQLISPSSSSSSSSSYQSVCEDTTTSPEASPHLPKLSENELITDATDSSMDKRVACEAPTLKVEYVSKVWDAYIDDFLLGCDHIDQAAIYDVATAKCIACSPDFLMTPEEFHHLVGAFSSLNLAYKKGVSINGRQYKMTLADGKRGMMARTADRDGCSACRTRTLVIIALHNRRASSRICNEELMGLGDFFWAKGL